jgi:protein-tyrosine phosphatase
MKIIPTRRGVLYASHLPSEKGMVDQRFDIIWNLAVERAKDAQWEKNYAKQVLLGNVPDYGIPNDQVSFLYQLDQVIECLIAGGTVLVHCLGGHGRTGMAVACIVNRLDNLSVDDAISLTKHLVSGPEVQKQIEFVKHVCQGNK